MKETAWNRARAYKSKHLFRRKRELAEMITVYLPG
jgi:hypothetical protein